MAKKAKQTPEPPAPVPVLAPAKPPDTLKIVIPSHKRWDILTTHKAVDIDAVCIPESQLAQYQKHNPGVPFVTHPDTVIGLHAKRNWIYQHFGSVFMFDDDVMGVYRSWLGQVKTHSSVLKPREVRQVVNNLFEMAIDCGAYLFGLSPVSTPMAYVPMKPFKLTGTVIGCSYGVRAGSKLYWNERMVSKEDCWISMLNAHHYRFAVIDNRFFTGTHEVYIRPGGLSGHPKSCRTRKRPGRSPRNSRHPETAARAPAKRPPVHRRRLRLQDRNLLRLVRRRVKLPVLPIRI